MTELARGSGLAGVVAEFDAAAGLGAIEAADGTRFDFHCIELVDGSREISVGTAVMFDSLPKLGRYEAANIKS